MLAAKRVDSMMLEDEGCVVRMSGSPLYSDRLYDIEEAFRPGFTCVDSSVWLDHK